jgi:hypothetical protein
MSRFYSWWLMVMLGVCGGDVGYDLVSGETGQAVFCGAFGLVFAALVDRESRARELLAEEEGRRYTVDEAGE